MDTTPHRLTIRVSTVAPGEELDFDSLEYETEYVALPHVDARLADPQTFPPCKCLRCRPRPEETAALV